MILLLSTAANLYWLGRYGERLKHLDKLLHSKISALVNDCDSDHSVFELAQGAATALGKPSKSVQASLAKKLGEAFGLGSVASPQALAHLLTEDIIVQTVKSIEANVQQVRGVIAQDTFELYNLVKRLSDSHSHHAAALQLYASDAAMSQETELVKLFWQIGVSMENIDNAFRLKRPIANFASKLAEEVYSLPANTAWHELDRSASKLKTNHKHKDFEELSRDFGLLLAKGV